MEKFDVVQITDKIVDKSYVGCLGIIAECRSNSCIISFYTPKEQGKNAFVKKVEFNNNQITVIGKCILKPK